jgi:alpha-galactosidase
MLEVGNGGMSEVEYTTHMTLWAMSAAPLLMGHDLRQTPPAMLRTARESRSDRGGPGCEGHPGQSGAQGRGPLEIWSKPLADGSVALALFNRGDANAKMEARAADAGFAAITSARDLWRGRRFRPMR